jgi:hypothetical protein
LIRETTENESANEGYRFGQEEADAIAPFSFGSLLGTQLLLMGWVESKLSASLQRKLNQQDDDYLREQSQRDLQIPFQRGSMLC